MTKKKIIIFADLMDTPFIPTWSRVKSAIPDFLISLEKTVNEDNMRYL